MPPPARAWAIDQLDKSPDAVRVDQAASSVLAFAFVSISVV
jgi:hypothetical protein